MKSVNTFPDAQVAIRDIYNQLDLLRSKNWDFHQRRIVNAHPSIDTYDYVVRKELLDLKGTSEQVTNESSGSYEKVVFGIGIARDILVVADVCPHYISLFKLVPDVCLFKTKTAPTGSDLTAQIYQNGINALFSTAITIPAGSTTVQEKSDFALNLIDYKDYLTCSILSVGSTIKGQGLTIYLRFKIVGVPK